jgi:4-hydroxymandelate oxidase
VREFLEGGAGREVTLRRNTAMFDELGFAPTVMNGRPSPELSTSFLGMQLSLPVITAPFGADRLFHAEGQRDVVRAAATAGTVSIVPEASSFSLEELASTAPQSARIGQLHPVGEEIDVAFMAQRYEAAGYAALCVTVDFATPGWREHNLRSGYVISREVVGGNFLPDSQRPMEQALGQLVVHDDPVWTWEKLASSLANSTLPWIAKGIMTPMDAVAAVEAGASAVLVSNHGGRQLDGVPSTIEVLPSIVRAVGGSVAIAFDSGIRSGADVVKAIALGADVVVIGRLAAYGLAAGGRAGVERTFDLLRDEMTTVLRLLGHGDITEIGPSAVVAF